MNNVKNILQDYWLIYNRKDLEIFFYRERDILHMKKLFVLFIAAITLAGCNDDTTLSEAKASSSTKKDTNDNVVVTVEAPSQEAAAEVTLEEATRISTQMHYNFKDIWLNAEALYLSLDEPSFSPLTHADRLMKRYKNFATSNFLTKDFQSYVEQSCYICDRLPASQNLQFAENIELTESTKKGFTLKAYLLLDTYTPEANVVQYFVYQNGFWKIDREEIEVLQEADGLTSREVTAPSPSEQFKAIYSRGKAAMDEFQTLLKTIQEDSITEVYNQKVAVKDELQSVVTEFEQMIIPFDPYYETYKLFWTKIYEQAVQNSKEYTRGVSDQETFIVETEAKLLQHRIETLYLVYGGDL
jgi:hypothetical protein